MKEKKNLFDYLNIVNRFRIQDVIWYQTRTDRIINIVMIISQINLLLFPKFTFFHGKFIQKTYFFE